MDPFVADPGWGVYIIAYFYLGGIAAGAYAVARLADLFGQAEHRRAARVADYLAFPLVNLCGLLLVIDLGRPERFWHMLIQSQTFRPMFKWWSPMSVGSWGLSVFGAFSFASFLAVLAEDNWFGLGRWKGWADRLRRGWALRLFAAGGLLSAFFLGSYTGALLGASNQPVWADSTWIAPLFLASATSTGLAAIILLVRWRMRDVPHEILGRFERLDTWAMAMEGVLLLVLFASLGSQGMAVAALGRWPGVLLPAVVLPIGLLLPLAAKQWMGRRGALAAAALILVGGLALRAGVVGMPSSLVIGDQPLPGASRR